MANREENLKKINEELEQLSDDELEKVAGGTELDLDKLGETISDFMKLIDGAGYK